MVGEPSLLFSKLQAGHPTRALRSRERPIRHSLVEDELVWRQQHAVVQVVSRPEVLVAHVRGKTGRGGATREDIITLHAHERILRELDVAVTEENVLAVLVVVVAVAHL